MEYLIVIALVLGLLFLPRIRTMIQNQTGTQPAANPQEEAARQRVRQVKYVYIHLAFFAMTMLAAAVLVALGGDSRAALIAGVVWGLALGIHAFVVFIINGPVAREWEQRRVRSMLDDTEEDRA